MDERERANTFLFLIAASRFQRVIPRGDRRIKSELCFLKDILQASNEPERDPSPSGQPSLGSHLLGLWRSGPHSGGRAVKLQVRF